MLKFQAKYSQMRGGIQHPRGVGVCERDYLSSVKISVQNNPFPLFFGYQLNFEVLEPHLLKIFNDCFGNICPGKDVHHDYIVCQECCVDCQGVCAEVIGFGIPECFYKFIVFIRYKHPMPELYYQKKKQSLSEFLESLIVFILFVHAPALHNLSITWFFTSSRPQLKLTIIFFL